MKRGEIICAKTHAELLNKVLGTNYKAWMKSSIKLPDGRLLWMIELGSSISPAGWINKMTSANSISEKHVGGNYAFSGHETYVGSRVNGISWDPSDRAVFDILKIGSVRKYVFRGVFRINTEKSSLYENVWDLILDEYNF